MHICMNYRAFLYFFGAFSFVIVSLLVLVFRHIDGEIFAFFGRFQFPKARAADM